MQFGKYCLEKYSLEKYNLDKYSFKNDRPGDDGTLRSV